MYFVDTCTLDFGNDKRLIRLYYHSHYSRAGKRMLLDTKHLVKVLQNNTETCPCFTPNSLALFSVVFFFFEKANTSFVSYWNSFIKK